MTQVFFDSVYNHLNASTNPTYISVSLEATENIPHVLPPNRYVQVHREFGSTRVIYNILAWPVKPMTVATSSQIDCAEVVVPVIYFTLYNRSLDTGNFEVVTNVDKIIELLVPESYHDQVRGGISQGINPATGLPGFFLHPCRTEAWMETMGFSNSSNGIDNSEKYVMWLQTFGQVVGL